MTAGEMVSRFRSGKQAVLNVGESSRGKIIYASFVKMTCYMLLGCYGDCHQWPILIASYSRLQIFVIYAIQIVRYLKPALSLSELDDMLPPKSCSKVGIISQCIAQVRSPTS